MKKWISILLLLLCLTGCSETEEKQEQQIFAFDTVMTFTAYGEHASAGIQQAIKQIYALEQQWSVTKEDSEVSRLNQGQQVQIGADTQKVLQKAGAVSRETDGAFDISIYPLVQAWGFTTGEYRVPSQEQLAGLLRRTGYWKIPEAKESLQLPERMEIDLGGIAKGYASEQAIQILQSVGVEHGIVSLGGNVQTLGVKPDGKPWKVAIQWPDGQGSAGTVLVQDGAAVITSGDYQRYFEQDGIRYHHILDPKTGYPAGSELSSVTVVMKDAARADGLSTALFVMGLEKGQIFWKEHRDFEAVWVTKRGEIFITPGLKDHFMPEGQRTFSVIG